MLDLSPATGMLSELGEVVELRPHQVACRQEGKHRLGHVGVGLEFDAGVKGFGVSTGRIELP